MLKIERIECEKYFGTIDSEFMTEIIYILWWEAVLNNGMQNVWFAKEH